MSQSCYGGNTKNTTVRFNPEHWEGRSGAARRARVLVARARRRRDPARFSCPTPDRTEVLVRTLFSGVSRGTETLVFRGGVPASQYAVMRAPFQDGRLPRAGQVRLPERRCRRARPVGAVGPQRLLPVPASDQVRRAGHRRRRSCPTTYRRRGRCSPARSRPPSTSLWDAAPLLGDRITVVGAGMVGCCVARLLARFPGVEVTLVDTEPAGRGSPPPSASTSRCRRAAAGDRDLVIHTSAIRGRTAARRSTCWPRRAPSSMSVGTAMPRSGCRSAAPSIPGG